MANIILYHLESWLNRLKKNPILILILCAVIVRASAFIIFEPWEAGVETSAILLSDQKSYHDLAVSIIDSGFLPQAYWMPGWPAFIAIIYVIFGIKPWVVILFNIVLNAVTIFTFFSAVKYLLSDRVAMVASILLAFDPHQIIYSQFLYSENLFIPVMMLFLYFFLRYINVNQLKYLVISGLFAGGLVYIRSVALYFYFVPFVILLISKTGSASYKIKTGMIFILVVFLTQLPLSLKNYLEQGRWEVTANGGYNLLFVYAGSVYVNQLGYSQEETNRLLVKKVDAITGGRPVSQFEFEDAAKSVAMDIIKQYPLEYLQNHILGCFNIYTSLSTYNLSTILGMQQNKILNTEKYGSSQIGMFSEFFQNKSTISLLLAAIIVLILLAQYTLSMAGIFELCKERKWRELIIPLLFMLYFTLITGVIGSSARFKLPITPYYLIFSAIGYTSIKDRFSIEKNACRKGI